MAGDAAAIGDLLAAARGDLRRYARRACRTTSDAEDAVQEALIILYRRVGALRQAGAISGWLFTTVSRVCLRLGRAVTGIKADPEEAALDRRFATLPMDDLRIDLSRAIEIFAAALSRDRRSPRS
ncbi:MAG: sigma factor [Micropepsaceae bacterium]